MGEPTIGHDGIAHPTFPPGIAAGLIIAQRYARAIYKDGKNEHAKYRYAKSESVIDEGRQAMNEGELALVQTRDELHLLEHGEQTDRSDDREEREKSRLRGFIRIDYLIVCCRNGPHMGESYGFRRDWPCIVQKGRPLDKAVGGALTTALAYAYRDLLGIPRDDELAAMDRRNDEPEPKQPREEPAREEPRREEPRREEPAPDSQPRPANDGPARTDEHPFLRLLPLIQSRAMKAEVLAGEIDKADLTKDERTALDFVVQAFGAKDVAGITAIASAIRKSSLDERLRTWTLKAFRPAWDALNAEPASKGAA